jgi:hypothetical protein
MSAGSSGGYEPSSPVAEREESSDSGPIISDVLLRRLKDQLVSRGLEFRSVPHGHELIEVDITNPRDPDRGRVILGYDGFLTWEYKGPFMADADADIFAELIWTLLNALPPKSSERACRCACGATVASSQELDDHLSDSFVPEDDIGVDGKPHYEIWSDIQSPYLTGGSGGESRVSS